MPKTRFWGPRPRRRRKADLGSLATYWLWCFFLAIAD